MHSLKISPTGHKSIYIFPPWSSNSHKNLWERHIYLKKLLNCVRSLNKISPTWRLCTSPHILFCSGNRDDFCACCQSCSQFPRHDRLNHQKIYTRASYLSEVISMSLCVRWKYRQPDAYAHPHTTTSALAIRIVSAVIARAALAIRTTSARIARAALAVA